MTKKQRGQVAMYAARGLSSNEINIVTRIGAKEIRAYCKKEGIALCRPTDMDPRRKESDPDELRARWETYIGPMKARLREAILYDAA